MNYLNPLIFRSNHSTILIPPTNNEQKPKLQFSPPKDPPDEKKAFGSYCIRVTSHLINEETNNVDTIIKGYDTTMDIMERVKTVCNDKQRTVVGSKCTDPEICFLKDKLYCDGQIIVKQGEQSWIVPPPFFG